MKKLIALALALMLICSMAVPAYAFDFDFRDWKPIKTIGSAPTTEVIAPTISNARYCHSKPARLQIEWSSVENADSYVVLIVKANGEIETYTTTKNLLYLTTATCPKVYIEDTLTWAAATVRVMAVIGTNVGDWSDPVQIGCDKLH